MAPLRKKLKLTNGDAAKSSAIGDGANHEEDVDRSQSKDNHEKQQRRSLFVRSLPPTTTSESLTELFSESYPIKHATAVIDSATQQCRGYGFVTFADTEDAERAREEFNGHLLDGRRLRIEIAEPRRRDSANAEPGEKPKAQQSKPGLQEAPQPSRLIVRNLPWTIKTSEQLSKLFMSYGKIKQAYIPKNKHGLLAGFGFVVLRGRKNAEKALEGINGKEVDGRTIAVDWAVSKDVYEDALNQAAEPAEDLPSKEHAANDDGEQGDDESSNDLEDDDALSEDQIDPSFGEDDDQNSDSDVQMNDEALQKANEAQNNSSTIFVRNLPFTCTDEDLEDHFGSFGSVRYARVVMDLSTGRSKGTGFVCFYNKSDSEACLRNAPRAPVQAGAETKETKVKQLSSSVLQNEASDPSGTYTLDGRVLQISRAVAKSEADRLTEEGAAHRRKRDGDKRRLYLLSEGTISSRSKLWEKLSTTEQNMREASAKQRKTLIESNPSLHLSLTRLSVRNIPRSVTSKDLKSLAREAVVGFATDVKAGVRQKLSKEELARGGSDMELAENNRKKTGKGVVKQAKVVFEGAGGSKVEESSGAGRSRGYGFIEFYTHRCALMGLRWLNGHAVGYQVKDQKNSKTTVEQIQDRKKRLIVEFAIENAQVVLRRNDREQKARDRSQAAEDDTVAASGPNDTGGKSDSRPRSLKRKRDAGQSSRLSSRGRRETAPTQEAAGKAKNLPKKPIDEKIAKRNQIIGRKRAMRRARKATK